VKGIEIVAVTGAFLMPSSSRSGLIHRVSHIDGCDCEAGRAGRICRHRVVIEIIEQAQLHTMPALKRGALIEEPRQAPADWPHDTNGTPLDWYAAKRAVETRPLGDRLAAARKASAISVELFG